MPTAPLAGQIALVTGANHGIGAATATALAARGADVAVTYLRTGDPNRSASGWRKDSYAPKRADAVGRTSAMVDRDSIDAQLHVDARAGALLMAEFITRHRDRGSAWGRIVTLTSGEGRQFPGEVSYGAGKAALISYTLSAAAEMAGDGVTANVVYPPVTDTGWITDEVRAFVANDLDHHHIAEPGEVADVIGWLCSEAGRIVTGNIIRLR